MTIDQNGVIDFISIERGGHVRLAISDHLNWEDDIERHLSLLQEKLNLYLSFIESGEILEAYPNSKGKDVMITIVCKYEPNEIARDFIDRAAAVIEDAGFTLNYQILTSD